MAAHLHHAALRVFGRLPRALRRRIVRAMSPSYTVGAMCFIERGDGALLLVRHSYRDRWGVPGGLLKRGEEVTDGVRREVDEEVGLGVELLGEPAVVVDAAPQRVDVIFRARPVDPTSWTSDDVPPRSPEIVEARWFQRDQLPELQFETADALLTLARLTTMPTDRRSPDPAWHRSD